MKREHVRMINAGAIGLILGLIIAAVVSVTFGSDSAQAESESSEVSVTSVEESQPETEEVPRSRLEDAEFVKAMPEREQAQLIAIVCLATEKGNAPSEVAESIADNFDAISEDYAQSFVSASLITVCNQASE